MPDEPKTLAEFLGMDAAPVPQPLADATLAEIEDGRAFGLAVLNSVEFKRYILMGLSLGTLPGFAGILRFWLEHAVGKTPDRVELTGKNGGPIETVTEVRRVIVRPSEEAQQQQRREEEVARKTYDVH